MATITRGMREAAASIHQGRKPLWGDDTLWALASAGLATREQANDWEPVLTPAGVALAEAEVERQEAAKAKRPAGARARSAAMRGLGMRRTAYGWE